MKKSTVFFILTGVVSVALACYNKNRGNPKIDLARHLLLGIALRLASSLKKAIFIKSALSLGAVTLAGYLCKKSA